MACMRAETSALGDSCGARTVADRRFSGLSRVANWGLLETIPRHGPVIEAFAL